MQFLNFSLPTHYLFKALQIRQYNYQKVNKQNFFR